VRIWRSVGGYGTATLQPYMAFCAAESLAMNDAAPDGVAKTA
jgi:hypothetical protein